MLTEPWIVTISWPQDEDRGQETYGPFTSQSHADEWVRQCQEAASLGWNLLLDAHYLIDRMSKPFDPESLMKDGMEVEYGPPAHRLPEKAATGHPHGRTHGA